MGKIKQLYMEMLEQGVDPINEIIQRIEEEEELQQLIDELYQKKKDLWSSK